MSDAFTTIDAEAAELARLTALLPKPKRASRPIGPPLVDIRNLQIRFGEHGAPVIRGINLTLHRGECLALVGESGSGKSVTARTLVGLTGAAAQITADSLLFSEQDLRTFTERRWRELRGGRIGFVMQDALGSLDPLKTVGAEIAESLRLHTSLNREQRAAKVVELLRAVGVSEPDIRARQHPHQLSGGMRQRALIASAIACSPELLIADEPTTALDAAVQMQVLDLLESLRTPQNAMIVVSHDFAVVSRLADSVAVMHRGVIVEQGPIEAVLQNPQHAYTRSLLDAVKSVHVRGFGKPDRSATATTVCAPAKMETVLSAERLTKAFTGPDAKKRTAVSNVSFDLRAGETIGIVGESGSGKTTTIRMILGLEKPDSGVVRIKGRDWQGLSRDEQRLTRRRMQVVFQDPLSSFDPRYTAERVLNEAIDIAQKTNGEGATISKNSHQRALQLIELVRLDPTVLSRRPIELSGGQRQRLAIARALAARPDILVCDEPVSALDVSVQKQILDLLADLKKRLNLACLFISHDLGVIQRISDHVLVMKDGSVIESGEVREIFAYPKQPYTQTLLSAIPFPEFLGNAIDI
ncbi:MAG TPA: ABC transporter ATP-binding protein [Opitutaceae bacterium]